MTSRSDRQAYLCLAYEEEAKLNVSRFGPSSRSSRRRGVTRPWARTLTVVSSIHAGPSSDMSNPTLPMRPTDDGESSPTTEPIWRTTMTRMV